MMLRPKYTYNTHGNMLRMLNISDNEKVFVRMEGEVIRYQYDNHLGSACLELDEYGYIISYEEYHPFGTTSYRAGRSATEVSWKRYKYCGKERDEETGLYYYGARYYAAWLGRFVSVDPLQFKYPHYTPYQYAGNKPITYIDLDGAEEFPNPFDMALKELEGLWNYAVNEIKSLNPLKSKEVVHNTTDATIHYFYGKGEPVKLDQKFVQALMGTEKFKEKHERIIMGITESSEGNFGIDMTNISDAFFIGRTNVNYRVETSADEKISTVIYTLFIDDGFWDVDFINEKIFGEWFGIESQTPDRKGTNLEILGGTPYEFIPETIEIMFPTPVPNNDPKYDNPSRQY